MAKPDTHVFVCKHRRSDRHPRGSCGSSGSDEVIAALATELLTRGLTERVKVTTCACIGPCEIGPNILVYPDGILYGHVTAQDIPEIFDSHFEGGKPVARLVAPASAW